MKDLELVYVLLGCRGALSRSFYCSCHQFRGSKYNTSFRSPRNPLTNNVDSIHTILASRSAEQSCEQTHLNNLPHTKGYRFDRSISVRFRSYSLSFRALLTYNTQGEVASQRIHEARVRGNESRSIFNTFGTASRLAGESSECSVEGNFCEL